MWKVDLKIFFKESWKKYGFVFLLVLVQCVGFRNLIQQYNTVNGQEWKLHFWDYVICFFQGTVPYTQSEGKETFNIPPYWSLYLIYFVLLIGKLTGQFSKKYEQQMLLRLKNRKQWWMESHLKIWLECMGYLAVTAIAFLVFSFCTKSAVEGINLELLKDYLGLEINKNNFRIFCGIAGTYLYSVYCIISNQCSNWNFGFYCYFNFQCISDPSVFNRKLFYVYTSDDVCYG